MTAIALLPAPATHNPATTSALLSRVRQYRLRKTAKPAQVQVVKLTATERVIERTVTVEVTRGG